jgi:hypothetical protein
MPPVPTPFVEQFEAGTNLSGLQIAELKAIDKLFNKRNKKDHRRSRWVSAWNRFRAKYPELPYRAVKQEPPRPLTVPELQERIRRMRDGEDGVDQLVVMASRVDERYYQGRVEELRGQWRKTLPYVPPPERRKVTNREEMVDALDALLGTLLSVNQQSAGQRKARNTVPNSPPTSRTPHSHLTRWREILDALGMKNTRSNQDKVRSLTKKCSGPIKLPKQGGQPEVVLDALLDWWNKLETQFQESTREDEEREDSTRATVQDRHNYSKHGEVVPNIAGHTKKRRSTNG